MKVAVLVSGHIRTWEECENKDWMWKYDVFASTYTHRNGYHPFIAEKYSAGEENSVNLLQIYPFKKIVWHSDDRDMQAEEKFHPNMKEIYHGYYQYTCFKRGLDTISEYEKETGIEYDVIIKTRFDLDYEDKFTRLTDVIIQHANNAKNVIIFNSKGSQPNDFVFIAKKVVIHSLANYCIQQYFFPEKDVWLNPPHGMLNGFMKNVNTLSTEIALARRPFKKLKIALCITGNVEGYPFDIENTKHDVDVFIFTCNRLVTKKSLGDEGFVKSRGKWVLETEENKDDFFRNKYRSEIWRKYPECDSDTLWKAAKEWYKIYKTKIMVEKTQKKYDLVIRWKSTVSLNEHFPWSLVEFYGDGICIPAWNEKSPETTLGLMDDFFFGYPQDMLKIMDEYNRFDEDAMKTLNLPPTTQGFFAHALLSGIPSQRFSISYNVGKEKVV